MKIILTIKNTNSDMNDINNLLLEYGEDVISKSKLMMRIHYITKNFGSSMGYNSVKLNNTIQKLISNGAITELDDGLVKINS